MADEVKAEARLARLAATTRSWLPDPPFGWFRSGQAGPRWRNQALAWFLSRLQLAQAEGQGIPTILQAMRTEGCPEPVFAADDSRVLCTLPAHPRQREISRS